MLPFCFSWGLLLWKPAQAPEEFSSIFIGRSRVCFLSEGKVTNEIRWFLLFFMLPLAGLETKVSADPGPTSCPLREKSSRAGTCRELFAFATYCQHNFKLSGCTSLSLLSFVFLCSPCPSLVLFCLSLSLSLSFSHCSLSWSCGRNSLFLEDRPVQCAWPWQFLGPSSFARTPLPRVVARHGKRMVCSLGRCRWRPVVVLGVPLRRQAATERLRRQAKRGQRQERQAAAGECTGLGPASRSRCGSFC